MVENERINIGEIVENTDNIIMSTESIEQFDFSSDSIFDIESSYELIEKMKSENPSDEQKEILKLNEARNIIKDTAGKYLDAGFLDLFTKEEENLINLIKRYNPNDVLVRNMSEDEKNKIYEIAQYLFNVYQLKLNKLNYDFTLTNAEYKMVNDVFRNKLEYDQNEVFQLKELKENYLDKEYVKDNDNHYTRIDVNDLIIFYHLFSKHKVKGINSDYYNFLSVLSKIGERIKLFNAYNVIVQRLSSDFVLWGGSLDVEGPLSTQVLEPMGGITKEEVQTEVVEKK